MTVPERQWDSMSPGEKQSLLLNQALDVKRGHPNHALAGPKRRQR
jgi:hypothetical protein